MKNYHYSCRKCTGRCIRYGKSKNKQRWKCTDCGTTQFRVYKPVTVNTDRKRIMKRLNAENVGIRGMARLLSISPTQVVRCLFQMAQLVKRPDYYEYGQDYELDELWSYSTCKKNQQWVIWAINRKTRAVIDFVVGQRTKATVNRLVEKLKGLYPRQIRTDEWPGYKTLFSDIPGEIHKPGRRITNRIERQGATVRNSIKRLNRKTISFSKSPKMLEAVLLLYFEECRWRPYRSGYLLKEALF